MSTWLEELKAAFDVVTEKSAKFYDKGNSTAGGDARKALQTIRTLAKTGRDDIQKVKNDKKAAKAAKA